MIKEKAFYVNVVSLLVLLFLVLLSLSYGETEISFKESIEALLGIGSDENIFVVQQLRFPRVVVGICVGMTLSLSGLFTRIALDNPLADSGILGIQSGATFFALLIILALPSAYFLLPLASFLGGLLAFGLVLIVSYDRGIKSNRIILSGVAISSFFTSLIGLLQIFNAQELQNSLGFLNGSLSSISQSEMTLVLWCTLFAVVMAIFLIPVLKILLLDDIMIMSLGKNPSLLRILICTFAVFLASVSVAFVGIISFLGILGPQISRLLVKVDFKYYIVQVMLSGAIIIVGADVFQRIIFNPMEVPVGIIVGLISTPVFLILVWRQNSDKK